MIMSLTGTDQMNIRKNFSMDLFMFNMKLKNYYPLLITSYLCVDLPKSLNTIANWVVSNVNKTIEGNQPEIRFISRDVLIEFVDWKLIPVELKGPRKIDMTIPVNSKPLKNLGHFNFSVKSLKSFHEYHEKIIENINEFSLLDK